MRNDVTVEEVEIYESVYNEWFDSEDEANEESSDNEVEEVGANTNQPLIEPKPEKTIDIEKIDYSKIEVFLCEDWYDSTECVNFVEKYPEIWLKKIVPEPFGLQKMKVLHQLFNTALQKSVCNLEGRKQEASNHAKTLLTPVEQMQQTRRALELERTLLNQKIEKLDKEFRKKAEGALLQEINAIKITDRYSGALKNFEGSKNLKSESSAKFKQWQEKMKADIASWSVDDVLTFLEEAEVAHDAAEFSENQINGAVLLHLSTDELVNDLQMSFHAAKRLRVFLLLVQSGGDIYDELPPVLNWENEQVLRWLNESGLSAHEKAFKKNHVRNSLTTRPN